jgi:hypothetical protein
LSTRSRYDTTALVDKMRQERRRNLLLGVCAAGTLGGLVMFYMLNMRGMTIPEVPADATPHAPRGQAAATTVGGTAGMGAPAPGVAPPTAQAPNAPASLPAKQPRTIEEQPPGVVVRSNMPSGALVWIDDAGVPRGTQLRLTEGRHSVRVKIGKHSINERFEVRAGESLELRLDSKKKKLVVERNIFSKGP